MAEYLRQSIPHSLLQTVRGLEETGAVKLAEEFRATTIGITVNWTARTAEQFTHFCRKWGVRWSVAQEWRSRNKSGHIGITLGISVTGAFDVLAELCKRPYILRADNRMLGAHAIPRSGTGQGEDKRIARPDSCKVGERELTARREAAIAAGRAND